MEIGGFDWDDGNWPKCAKHGVKRNEIEEVLIALRFVVDDPSPDEKRYRTAGVALSGRHVFVVFTFRDRNKERFIRPISARYMHEKEVRSYEKEMARLERR